MGIDILNCDIGYIATQHYIAFVEPIVIVL